ncbi:hypothetical protein JRG48_10485 [Staphylococcus caprae]|nr:hypothetical protein [Staphylococcus caprae]MBN6826743.1 hypothetical protein [Staphylococcus caprae]
MKRIQPSIKHNNLSLKENEQEELEQFRDENEMLKAVIAYQKSYKV